MVEQAAELILVCKQQQLYPGIQKGPVSGEPQEAILAHNRLHGSLLCMFFRPFESIWIAVQSPSQLDFGLIQSQPANHCHRFAASGPVFPPCMRQSQAAIPFLPLHMSSVRAFTPSH